MVDGCSVIGREEGPEEGGATAVSWFGLTSPDWWNLILQSNCILGMNKVSAMDKVFAWNIL